MKGGKSLTSIKSLSGSFSGLIEFSAGLPESLSSCCLVSARAGLGDGDQFICLSIAFRHAAVRLI